MVARGRKPGCKNDAVSVPLQGRVEIRSLIPEDPFAGLNPRFGEDTKILFVVEGPKAVAVRRNISVRTLLRRFRDGGRTPRAFARRVGPDLVATLLGSGVPVGAVARAVGLSGSQALGRFVRSCFGLTPTGLREELRRRAAANR